MRFVNNFAISAGATTGSLTSGTLDSNQWIAASFMAYFSENTGAGTVKIQYSNDVGNTRLDSNNFVPTNWADVPGTTATATAAAGASVTVYLPVNFVARWLRIVFTRTGGAGTMSVTYEALYA